MLLTTLAFAQGIANVMNNLNYQIVGIMVVMMCLGGLAVILTISGSIAAAIQNRAKSKTAAPVAAPAAAPRCGGQTGMTPEMLAILSAAVDSAMTELTPEMDGRHLRRRGRGPGRMSHRIVKSSNPRAPAMRPQAGRKSSPPTAFGLPVELQHYSPLPPPRREPFNLILHTIHYHEELRITVDGKVFDVSVRTPGPGILHYRSPGPRTCGRSRSCRIRTRGRPVSGSGSRTCARSGRRRRRRRAQPACRQGCFPGRGRWRLREGRRPDSDAGSHEDEYHHLRSRLRHAHRFLRKPG